MLTSRNGTTEKNGYIYNTLILGRTHELLALPLLSQESPDLIVTV